MRFAHWATVMCAAAVLSGCAMPARIVLQPEQREAITDLQVQVIIAQDEVHAAVEPPNVSRALGGGLIGAMIDASIANSRSKDAQQSLLPFYAAIEGVDFRKEFTHAVLRELPKYPIKVSVVSVTPGEPGAEALKAMRSALRPGQALLVLAPRYSLSVDRRQLNLQLAQVIWDRLDDKASSSGRARPVHRSLSRYHAQPLGAGGEESLNLWRANDAALFRAAIQDAIAEAIAMALVDLRVPAVSSDDHEFSYVEEGNSSSMWGLLVEQTPSRVRFLGSDYFLHSVPRPQQVAPSIQSQ